MEKQKLKTEHLSTYLHTKLMCKVKDGKKEVIGELKSVYADGTGCFHDIVESEKGFSEIKPLLRKIDDVEDYFKKLWDKNNGETMKYMSEEYLCCLMILEIEEIKAIKVEQLPVETYNLLIKHHFDVFDLIPQGLAEEIKS